MAAEQTGRLPLDLPGRGLPLPVGESRLARLAAEGNERAFATLFRRYHQELYRYCRAILGDPDDAQDALQSTMVKALRALPGDERSIALRPWLYRVAHNEAITILRARRPVGELDTEHPDWGATPEREAVSRERLRHLVEDLEALPERRRAALVMRELSGLEFAEIGEAFGISAAAAKQSVYEARQALLEMSEAREMDCHEVRESISANDRRRLRGRRIRTHLRTCEGCRGFEAAIGDRRAELAALAPPVAVPAGLAALQGALGVSGGSAAGVGATAGAVGSGAIGGAGAVLGAKAAASALAAAVIAGGALELGGVADLPTGERGAEATRSNGSDPARGGRDASMRGSPAAILHSPSVGPAAGTRNTGARAADPAAANRGGRAAEVPAEPRGVAHGVRGTQPGHARPKPFASGPPAVGKPSSAGHSESAPAHSGKTPAAPAEKPPPLSALTGPPRGGTAGLERAPGPTGPPQHSGPAAP